MTSTENSTYIRRSRSQLNLLLVCVPEQTHISGRGNGIRVGNLMPDQLAPGSIPCVNARHGLLSHLQQIAMLNRGGPAHRITAI